MDAWNAFKAWLDANAPELAATLLPAASSKDLDDLEHAIGHALPPSVRAWWSACGGQRDVDGPGVAGDFVLLSPRDALAEWKKWAEIRAEQTAEAMDELRSTASSHPE